MSSATHYLLDTNIASFIVNGRSRAARTRFNQAAVKSTLAISTVTQAEIHFGLEKKPESIRLRSYAAELFETLTILPWDSAAAVAYAQLRKTINSAGKSLAILDLQIAAHALSLNATLVTHDRAFRHLSPLLKIEDWATDL